MLSRGERGIDNAVRANTARHWINDPAHAHSLIREQLGQYKSLDQSEQDDPLLYAYEIRDHLPSMAKAVIDLTKWVNAVIDATPEQIPERGAKPCLYST